MTMDLYLETSFKLSWLLTRCYSTSFSLGIRAFPNHCRQAIHAIYGFVRLGDEIVDSFQRQDSKLLFERFRHEVNAALREKISLNPILHAFQATVHEYGIPEAYIDAFLVSMDMDLTIKTHNRCSYEKYIYGSAEVVGLMCLKVFCVKDDRLFAELITPAQKLGAAFQKVNFLRDIRSDWEDRGRIYLPDMRRVEDLDRAAKIKMEQEIASDFLQAEKGIFRLPRPYRLAVLSVYLYYQKLFQKIQQADLSVLLEKRLRISNALKILLLIKARWILCFR